MTAIPTDIQRVLDLFQGKLAPLSFGGLEANVLGRAADAVHAAASALEDAEKKAEQARLALAEKQEELATKAQRALAYARIYAEEDADLATDLEGISLSRTTRRPPADEAIAVPLRRRGRPPKNDTNGSLLMPRAEAPAAEDPATSPSL